MYEILDQNQHPEIILIIDSIAPNCSPEIALTAEGCSLSTQSRLNVKGIERSLKLSAKLTFTDDCYTVTGKVSFYWPEFEIEDPSILIAKLDPEVTVSYTVRIKIA